MRLPIRKPACCISVHTGGRSDCAVTFPGQHVLDCICFDSTRAKTLDICAETQAEFSLG